MAKQRNGSNGLKGGLKNRFDKLVGILDQPLPTDDAALSERYADIRLKARGFTKTVLEAYLSDDQQALVARARAALHEEKRQQEESEEASAQS